MRAGERSVRPFWEGRLLAQGRGCRRNWAMTRQHSLTIHQEDGPGTCLAVQWLRLCASTGGGICSIPGQGRFLPAECLSREKKTKRMGQDPQAFRSASQGVLGVISRWPFSSQACCRAREPMHMVAWSRLAAAAAECAFRAGTSSPGALCLMESRWSCLGGTSLYFPEHSERSASPGLPHDSHTPWDIRTLPGTLASPMTSGSLGRIWTQPCLV